MNNPARVFEGYETLRIDEALNRVTVEMMAEPSPEHEIDQETTMYGQNYSSLLLSFFSCRLMLQEKVSLLSLF